MEKFDTKRPLRQSETRFHGWLESFPDCVLIVDDQNRILLVNRRFETMFGYDRSEVIGRPVEMLIPKRFPQHRDNSGGYHQNPEIRLMRHPGETLALRKGGSEFPVDIHLSPVDTAQGIIAVAAIHDITEQKQNETQLEYQANHDGLTGLPNRNLLEDRTGQALLLAERCQQQVAVLLVDLDRFKLFLTGLGHGMGDGVIKKIAGRLQACVRENSTVARLGDDVFAIVLSNLQESEHVSQVAQQVLDCVSRSMAIGPRVSEISCSIGISMYPNPTTTHIDYPLSCATFFSDATGKSDDSALEPIVPER